MRLTVAFTPHGLSPADLAGRTVFVIDILRATTTMAAALHHGACAVIPAPSTEEALRLAQTLDSDEVLLVGEQGAVRIEGFALGNSPREMTLETVRGKTLVMTTTNGTRALLATQGAGAVYPAAAANFSTAATRAREVWERDQDLLILCAGREEAFGLDDAYAAGRLAAAVLDARNRLKGLNDSAIAALGLVRRYGDNWERPLTLSAAGRNLKENGLRDDIRAAAEPDAHPLLLQFSDRRVTAVAAEP